MEAKLHSSNLSDFYMSVNDSKQTDFNNITKTSTQVLGPPLYIVLVSTILYCLIFLVGIVGNILVIIVIVFSRSMKTTVNKYLLNLCVADLSVISVCMPTALADIFTKEVWYFGEFMCKFVPFFENSIAHASVLTILAISAERYRVVCYPLKGVDENSTNVWKKLVLIWVISLLTSVPWLFIAILRPSTFYDGTPVQVCRNPIVLPWQKVYVVALSVLFFLIPSVVMIMLNCHLCRVLNKSRNLDLSIHENRQERKRKQNQVANIIASIVTIFFVCHLPYRIAVLWFSFEDKNVIWNLGLEKFLLLVYSTRILFYINHALNPVVYNFVSSKFRNALNLLCTKSERRKYTNMTALYGRQSNETPKSDKSLKEDKKVYLSNNLLSTDKTQVEAKILEPNRKVCLEIPNRHNERKQLIVTNGSSGSMDGSYLSENEYRVKIQIEDQSVAIRFKLKAAL